LEGYAYYTTALPERPFTSLHEVFKPSGLIGQGLGVFGSLLIIVGVSTYSTRKRWVRVQGLGKLRNWLTFHIFVCTLGPFLILLHTTFKIGNIASIAFWCMAIVVFSGVFGRYVYVHIPKSANGLFYSEHDMQREQAALVERVHEITALDVAAVRGFIQRFHPTPPTGFLNALWKAIRLDLNKGRLRRTLTEALSEHGATDVQVEAAAPLLIESARLDQQRQLSGPFQRLFGYWHVLHIPLALVMLVTFLIHIGVAIAFGYTWIF
jgi:hypothetical protein